MGMYLNPGNEGFADIIRSDYVDKTGLIALVNASIGTNRKLTCISRPRRFGKSYAAQMLCAYYDRSCDSRELFAGCGIAKDDSYEEHLNKYNIIYWDMTGIAPYTKHYAELVPYLTESIVKEIKSSLSDVNVTGDLPATLLEAVEKTGKKFVAIIDEWDAPIRENPEMQRVYLEFLRSLFKNSGATAKIFAAAYMTGILPISKEGSQSAISDFEEYTMVNPYMFESYVGFTESEVRELCMTHGSDFISMKAWYDGYHFNQASSVYNPNSVMKAIRYHKFQSYWTETSAASSLMHYISRDYNGLTKTIAELIGGMEVKVDTLGFSNDLTTFRGKDDVLTLLIHLGYLSYDAEKETAHIPNEEIKREFQKSIRQVNHPATLQRVAESDQLFLDTIEGREEAVAAQLEKIHAEESSPLQYHNEACLRSTIKLAYYTYRDNYLQWEELPAGAGYADIVYLPKPDSLWPALVIELKWNRSAETAIEQIKQRRYPDVLKDYGKEIVLVGVSYDKEAPAGQRRHQCRIEKMG